jgi:hypothetical protein
MPRCERERLYIYITNNDNNTAFTREQSLIIIKRINLQLIDIQFIMLFMV